MPADAKPKRATQLHGPMTNPFYNYSCLMLLTPVGRTRAIRWPLACPNRPLRIRM